MYGRNVSEMYGEKCTRFGVWMEPGVKATIAYDKPPGLNRRN